MKTQGMSFDAGQWTADVRAAVDQVRGNKSAPLSIEKTQQALAPMLDRLESVPKAQHAGLLIGALSQVATFDEIASLIAARLTARGEPTDAHQVVANLGNALFRVAKGPTRAATTPQKVEPTTLLDLPSGKISSVVQSLTDLPADITVVPQLPSGDPKNGGGGAGGVALAFITDAQLKDEKHMGELASYIGATRLYEQVRGTDYLPHGTTVVAPTGIDDRTLCPAVLVHIASVPVSAMTYRPEQTFPSKEAFQVHQQARMAFVEDMLRRALFSIRQGVATQGLKPSAEHPIRVSLPALGTGPKGAVTHEEAGVVMRKVLEEFQENNAGFDFVIAFHDDARDPVGFIAKQNGFTSGFTNQAIGGVDPAAYTPNDKVLEQLTQNVGKPSAAKTGLTLDDAYLEQKLGDLISRFEAKLGKLDDGDLADRTKALEHFPSRLEAELFWQLHKFAEIPGLAKGAPGQGVTKERMLQILNDGDIKQRLFALLKSQMSEATSDAAQGRFGGDANMPAILTAGLAYVLQRSRGAHLEAFHNQWSADLEAAQEKVAELEAQLAKSVDRGQLAQLRAELGAALDANKDLESANKVLDQRVKALSSENVSLTTQLRSYQDALRQEAERTRAFRQTAEYQQTSSYRPSARSS